MCGAGAADQHVISEAVDSLKAFQSCKVGTPLELYLYQMAYSTNNICQMVKLDKKILCPT